MTGVQTCALPILLIGLGFAPLAASGLSLIANTAPVAYGALGTPIIALAAVTGLDMFIAQAAAQFKLFTGEAAPADLMRQVARNALSSRVGRPLAQGAG
mgnify:CR=1 FL=1